MSRPALLASGKIASARVPATGGGSWLITLTGARRTAAVIIGAARRAGTPVAGLGPPESTRRAKRLLQTLDPSRSAVRYPRMPRKGSRKGGVTL